MADSQVKWYGDDFLKALREETPEALFEAAETFAKVAASRAPKGGSGDLRDSAYAGIEGKSTYKKRKNYSKEVKAKKGEAVAGFGVFYAKFIEFGTKKMRAQPFMRPTLDEAKGQLGDVITARLRKRFKK